MIKDNALPENVSQQTFSESLIPLVSRKPFRHPKGHLYFLILTAGYVWSLGITIRLADLLIGLSLLHLAYKGKIYFPKAASYFVGYLLFCSLLGAIRFDVSERFLFDISLMILYIIYGYALILSFRSFDEISEVIITCSAIIVGAIWIDFLVAYYFGSSTSTTLASWLLLGHPSPGHSYRPSGILYEPSEIALYAPGAMFLALYKRKYHSSLWFLSGVIISASTLAIVTTLIVSLAIVIASFKPRYAIFSLFILSSMFLTLYSSNLIKPVQSRIDGALEIITAVSVSTEDAYKKGGTVAGYYASSLMAKKGLEQAPVFGAGVASFLQLFPRYLPNVLPGAEVWSDERIAGDYEFRAGGGMFFRILFETGLLGTAIILYYLLYTFYHALHGRRHYELYAAMTFVLCYFTAVFMRKSNVLFWETWFCAVLIILSYRLIKRRTVRINANQKYY